MCAYQIEFIINNQMPKTIIGLDDRHWLLPSRANSHKQIIATLFANREIDIEEQERFFAKDFLALFDPRLLNDGEAFADILVKHIQLGSKIVIFGDYDTDGIPASALLHGFIKKIASKSPEVIIPKRSDGYGLTDEALLKINALKPALTILVDNGTTAIEAIEKLKASGSEVAVIDHHEPIAQLPKCIIVNHKRRDNHYPEQYLCATGLVYKMIQLVIERHFDSDPALLLWWKWQADLVALATVCDVVPLRGENRVLVEVGLAVIRKNRRDGLARLFAVSGFDPSRADTYSLGFVIGPRINAGGRIGDPRIGYEILAGEAKDPASAVSTLDELNKERQKIFEQAFIEAERMIDPTAKVFVGASPDWSEGIVGLIAAKISERYHIPAFAFSKGENKMVGSARSIEGVDLMHILSLAGEHALRYGGHQKAAGVSLDSKRFELWQATIVGAISKLDDKLFIKTLRPEVLITTELIDESLLALIERFKPFGFGNQSILWASEFTVKQIRSLGASGDHLRFVLEGDDGQSFEAIAFFKKSWKDKIEIGKSYLIAYNLEPSNWPGKKMDIKIVDIAENV